ncbi:MAG: ATP-binding protein [Ruminococcus sp.]|jgi:hypothetical protein|nr:ATP-binding protein [Ruminococcus sp.]
MKIPKRIASAVLNSLKGGVVPRVGLEYIQVGRKSEIDALLRDIEIIEDSGAAFRFIVGKYGSGKSFLLQTIRNYAMDRGFVVIDADLSPERRFSGGKGQGLATYRELIRNMATKTRPEGGALPLILEKWLSGIMSEVAFNTDYDTNSIQFDTEVRKRIFSVVNEIEGMVNGFDFAKALILYFQAYKENNDDKKSNVLKWFRGEINTKTEARTALGINFVITDDSWYDFIKLFACFLVRAGYKGMLMLVDELVNIYRIPNRITRQYNYEKILTMYNDTLQGKASSIGIIMGATPQFIEDTEKGVFSYDALRSRLTEGKFSHTGATDLMSPIIRLEPLQSEDMYILIEKLTEIHSELYKFEHKISHDDYVAFLKAEYERVGASVQITPREVIRDFIEVLNIIYQHPEKTVTSILTDSGFAFALPVLENENSSGLTSSTKSDDEFAEFVI